MKILIPILACAWPAAAFAQAPAPQSEPADEDPIIVVTGRGIAEAAAEPVFDAVALPRERLVLTPSTRLEDVLRDVPGFQLFRRSDARSANPTSQGATLRALGGNASSRLLLLLDGVPQTDPFGGWISWPAYDPRRLGSVRVVRGGGSGIYGPGALAGTIELDSAGPQDLTGLLASAAYGSRDSVDLFAALGAPADAGFVSLSGSYAAGNGFVPIVAEQRGPADRPAPYEQASLSARAVAPLAPDMEIQANLLAFTDERERGLAFSEIETRGADASLRLVGRGALPFSALAYVQTRQFATSFAAVDDDRTEARRVLDQYNVPSTGLGARFELRPMTGATELRIGADARQTSGRTQELYFFDEAGSPRRGRIAGGRTRTLGGFAELTRTRGALTLTGAARVDHSRIEDGSLREETLATGVPITDTAFADRTGWEPTGRVGAALAATPALTLRAAAYAGWRLPTLNELYRPFRVGADATAANAALDPERLRGAELGAAWRPSPWLRLGLTGFASRLENGIANVTLARGPGLFPGVGFVGAAGSYRQRRNLDAIETAGVEADLRAERGDWTLSAGYSYADARVRSSGAALPLDGLRPAQTPRHSASATLAWRSQAGAAASLGVRYVGDQFEDDLNRTALPEAVTLDAAMLVPVGGGFSLEARAENLADERVVAAIGGDGLIERASPRTLWIGLRFGD